MVRFEARYYVLDSRVPDGRSGPGMAHQTRFTHNITHTRLLKQHYGGHATLLTFLRLTSASIRGTHGTIRSTLLGVG